MEEKVLEAISRFALFEGVKSVTVALSGGADSMALLYALNSLKADLCIELSAAHFNHKIRGAEADRDAAFVKEQCEKIGIPLFIGEGDVPQFARENHLSLELAARELRYEFLSSVSKGVIATAHTASDNLETMLFNLARGTSAKGLGGIPAKRDNIVRPLLFCLREDVERYCKENNISFVTDSTNLSDAYSRNKLRLKAVPVLKEINSAVENNALKTAMSLNEDNDFIDSFAKIEFENRYIGKKLDIKCFPSLHPAVQKRVIKFFLQENGVKEFDNFHIASVCNIAISGGKTQISGDLTFVSHRGFLKKQEQSLAVYQVEILKENYLFSEKDKKVNSLLLNNAVDCDKIVGKLSLRTRASGDSIKLAGRNCTKTLKKLYTEKAVPLIERDTLPVIADDEGVVWVCGIGVCERCAVDKSTSNIFRFNVSKK
ncbi:MAG: tRNA lysidine(34) synthetase TilS [Clostridia bacterium]|nr:tRNA lysidine(34) synthetase TilS [Clostridia bacterium]